MNELVFIFVFFVIPGIIGFVMAKKRGKNPFLWGALSGVFPFLLVVLKMQFKPASREGRDSQHPSDQH